MFYIYLIAFLTGFVGCRGFLFDENTTPLNAGGQSLSDKHYLTVIDMIQEEKLARHQIEYYMTQLKDKIVENQNRTQSLETKFGQLSPKNETIKEENEIQLLKNATDFLLQEYRSLDTNFKQLQQKYSEVLKENDRLMQQWNSTAQQWILVKQELDGLKNLQTINQLQDVKNLQNENSLLHQKLQITNNRIESLASTQQARGQDLIALNNKAQAMESDLLQLAIQQNVTYSQLSKEMHKVALTSCARNGNIPADSPMLFPVNITSYGITNLVAFKSSGAFTCDIKGLYLVSFTVMSSTSDAFFHIYKNSEYLVDAYTANYGSSNYFSGTALVVVHLDVNDTVTIKPGRASFVYDASGIHATCLTVLKVN